METVLRAAGFADLDAATLYALLKLRSDVFVVEQRSIYSDLDGRDTEPGTRHMWFERGRTPIAYLRMLSDVEGEQPVARIGRVVTAKDARGHGLAGKLMAAALAEIGDRPCVLEAQTQVVQFYERYGFKVSGPEYIEDGIPHVPMRRT